MGGQLQRVAKRSIFWLVKSLTDLSKGGGQGVLGSPMFLSRYWPVNTSFEILVTDLMTEEVVLM